MSDNINQELANYLKTKLGLKRLMNKLKDKYISLSRPSGTVILNNLTKEESIDIGNLLGKYLFEGMDIKISFKEMTKKINEGKYCNFNWPDMLNYYFNETLITNLAKKANIEDEEYLFFKNIYDENKDSYYIKEVIEIISNNISISKIIKHKYHKNKKGLQQEMQNVFLLLNNLPKVPTSLAVYSALTGNPHYLDLNKSRCNLFLRILSEIKKINYQNTTDSRIRLLSEINVYTDPISNFVITYKLVGNSILNELNKNNEVVNLNLLNIKKLNIINTECQKIYIFENPSMLTSLLDLKVPIVITSGIPNISLYCLLEKLEKSGNKLFYNGDFDPEGLLIASKLKERFTNLELICYDEIDYNISKSYEKLSVSRLKKIENINIKELLIIKELVLKNALPGYQEQNLKRIRNYIEKNR